MTTEQTSTTNTGHRGTLVINLDQRPERLEYFRKTAASMPALSGWQRLPGIFGIGLPGFGEHPWFRGGKRDKQWAGRAGCILSHRNAIRRAQDENWDSVLILEDDTMFSGDFEQVLRAVESRPDWDICYLGFNYPEPPYGPSEEIVPGREFVRVYGTSTAHAYILRKTTFQWILDQLPEEKDIWDWVAQFRAIDRWYARNLSRRFKVFVVSPGAVGQRNDFSDIGQRLGADDREDGFFQPLPPRRLEEKAFLAASNIVMRKFTLQQWIDGIRGKIKKWKGF